jgi:metal-responsive CopG/Arc/MetJ family transcriptional regulator
MATVNYSIPDEIKEAFNAQFADRNKSAIIAELMQRAIEEEKQKQRRNQAIHRLLSRYNERKQVTSAEIQAAREELRK